MDRIALTRRAWLGGLAALWLSARHGGTQAASPSLLRLFGTPARNPARVFAAGPPAAVLLTCLAPERLLGWPMPVSDAAKALLPAVVRDKPMVGRLAGRGSTVSIETLLGLRPDLVLDAGAIDPTYVSTAQRVAEQTGLPYALLDGRLADTPAQLRELGDLLDVTARARPLAAYAEAALSAARRAGPGRAPGVYLARSSNGLETATAGAINAEFIEAAGGRNVADTGHAGVARVSMEQVLGWAPDWILTHDRNFHRMAASDAAWRTLPAVREGRLLLAPVLPFGWLDGPPSVNRLLGVRWLADSLQRGRAGTGDDAIDEALRFYALFYGAAPARETVRGWLDGRG